MSVPSKRALIFGSTGLTGSFVLSEAVNADQYTEVVCFNRKDIPAQFPKQKNIVTTFTDLHMYGDIFTGADVYCCLGTTNKQVNNNREAYYEADVARPYLIAKLSADYQAASYTLQTAMGANAKSSIFYNRLKGELEQQVMALPLQALYIYRPSLLTGPRKEHRSGEIIGKRIMYMINPLLIGSLRKYRSISCADVAKAMVATALNKKGGTHIFLSDAIQAIADGKKS